MINKFLENNYNEVCFETFYRDLFPVGSFEERGVEVSGRYNGIAVSIGQYDKKVRRHTVTDDLEKITELVTSDDFCLMSPISYIGKSRRSQNARHLYAMAIDLDGINGEKGMRFFLEQIEYGHEMLQFIWGLPKPTYVVSSGTGMHLYYVFDVPIALFPSAIKPLERLKRRITWQAWTQGALDKYHRERVQYESLFQGFRMVGSITKVGTRVRAFKVGSKVDIDYLSRYVAPRFAISAQDLSYKSALPLREAKEKYPGWYERRVVQKQAKGCWQCKRALYDWWFKRMKDVEQGHRYWGLMTLATYAIKCGIPYEELKKDAYVLRPYLEAKGDAFTVEDVKSALEAYDDSYVTYPIDTIVARTGLTIEKNKRNYRKQELHLRLARATRDILQNEQGKKWDDNNGRKPKKDIVLQWRAEHPNGRKIDCERETGLSRKTILKWWDE